MLSKDYCEALNRYGAITSPKGGMDDLVNKVMAVIKENIKPRTFAQYTLAANRIKEVFIDFSPDQIDSTHVAEFLDHYRDTPNMANRMRTVLKIVFSHGIRWGQAKYNPVIAVERFKEAKRTRYITDAEYKKIRANATPEHVPLIIDMCYLTGQRIGDVLTIKRGDITKEGIIFEQEKTGVKLMVKMSAEMKELINKAKSLHSVEGMNLFHTRQGKPHSYYAVRDGFKRACNKAGVENVKIHDIRAKAITDAKREGKDPQLLAGHSNPEMTKRYIRDRETLLVEGPKLGFN